MQPEFSRIVKIEDISEKSLVEKIKATESERLALAKRFGLISLDSFEATVTLQWKDSKQLQLKADFDATVQQVCVRTSDHITQRLQGHVEELFTTDPLPFQEEEMDLESLLAEPESLEGDEVDIGEIMSQHLSLDLNPYAKSGESEPVEHVESKSKSPFDHLKDLL